MSELTITKSNFNEIKNSTMPVLIDFWAPWCGPCRMMGPIVEELAEEYEGRAIVGKVNVDEEPELASAFGVVSIPTFALMQNGEVKNFKIGAVPKRQLKRLLS